MVDQRGTDNPPAFYLAEDIADHKYHALVPEPYWVPSNLVFDVFDNERGRREVNGEIQIKIPRGIYGFPSVKDRKAFCFAINKEEGDIVAVPITLTSNRHAAVAST